MIKSVSIGEIVDVPMRATFPIAFATSWTPQEAAAAESTVFHFTDPDGIEGDFAGAVTENATTGIVEVILQVRPTTFYKAGTWGLRPEVTFADDDIRASDLPLAVNVVDRNTVRYGRLSSLFRAQ